MAWTAPRTWASGEIPTAAQLNTDLRDNLNELSRHAHGGGSGSGTAALGNLVSMTFIDAAAPSAPGGTLTRVYSSSTALYWRNAGGIYSASTAGHEHSIASGTIRSAGSGVAGSINIEAARHFTLIASGATAIVLTQTATFGGTGSRAVVLCAQVSVYTPAGGGGSDGVEFSITREATLVGYYSSSGPANSGPVQYIISTIEYNLASGSYTYNMRWGNTTGTYGTALVFARSLSIVEVRQA